MIVLSNETVQSDEAAVSVGVKSFVEKYRRIVDSRLLFVSVDLGGAASCG